MRAGQVSLVERLWRNIRQDPSGCWIWTGRVGTHGYGEIQAEGRRWTVPRLMYSLLVEPLAPEQQPDHRCRVRSCVNPAHLEPVTLRENVLRGNSPAAVNARKTHCPQGHLYNEGNTYRRPGTGHRQCRECMRCHQRRNRYWVKYRQQKQDESCE